MAASPSTHRIAEVTGYPKNGCALNAFALVLAEQAGTANFQAAPGVNSLLETIKRIHGLPSLTPGELAQFLQGIGPVHQQVFLNESLRALLVEACRGRVSPARLKELANDVPVSAQELSYLAATVRIRVESIEDQFGLDALAGAGDTRIQSGDAGYVATLRLHGDQVKKHWSRIVSAAEMSDQALEAHNKAHRERRYYDEKLIRDLITQALKKEKSARALQEAFARHDANALANSNPFASVAHSLGAPAVAFLGQIEKLAESFGPFGQILQAIVGISLVFKKMGEQMNPGAPLTPEQQAAQPLAPLFNQFNEQLRNDNEGTAAALAAKWKQGAKPEAIFEELLQVLSSEGHYLEANQLLDQLSLAALTKMRQLGVANDQVELCGRALRAPLVKTVNLGPDGIMSVDFPNATPGLREQIILAKKKELDEVYQAISRFEEAKTATVAGGAVPPFDPGLVARLQAVQVAYRNDATTPIPAQEVAQLRIKHIGDETALIRARAARAAAAAPPPPPLRRGR